MSSFEVMVDDEMLNRIRTEILNNGSMFKCPSAEELRELFLQASSGTAPCTSCCTQCAYNCCNATYTPTGGVLCAPPPPPPRCDPLDCSSG
jgi:hypothetical protein